MEAFGAGRRRAIWHWTREEDELLTTLVNEYGLGCWDFIADNIRGRTGNSCRLRWMNQLDRKILKSAFTEEEQRMLIELQRKHGNKWSTIAQFFPGRTDNQVKNQYHVLVGSRYEKSSSGPCSSTDACGPAKRQCTGLSQYGSISSVPGSSQFSMANYCGASSSVYARDESMMAEVDSTATSKDCSVSQAQQAEGIEDYQFFDFMGVGSSV